ncbi:MAG: YbhN family protein [Thermoleophilaceae bacterium]
MTALTSHITPRITRKRALVAATATVAAGSLILLVPALAGLADSWNRIANGDPSWLALALGLEVLSFAGHILLFRTVCLDSGSRFGYRESYQVTMAGHAATRLLASAGAGGVALTAWSMRRAGMERRDVAQRMVTFIVLLYSVYMAALLVGGVLLFAGVLSGDAPIGVTLIPAAFGAFVIAIALASPLAAGRLESRFGASSRGWVRKLAPAPASLAGGVRDAIRLVRKGNLGLLGAIMWWGFDIAVLWACFHAFGFAAPTFAVATMAYFVGMFANTLPLPGGVGGVDGGMIGALLAFGVAPEQAVISVLAYRAFSFWLPIAPGAIAYFQLRRTFGRWDAASAEEPELPRREPARPHVTSGRPRFTPQPQSQLEVAA